jgi:hypothetical protein
MPAAAARLADHRIRVRLRQHRAREPARAAADCAEQRPLGIAAQARAVEIGDQIFLDGVWHGIACRLPPFSRNRSQRWRFCV